MKSDIMRQDVQLVVLGMGEGRYFNLFSWAETEYKGRVAARFTMDHALAHRIYAGTDMFLMPSQFEPCGLSQMIAMRYGTVPIVRETGGLRDTVLSYNDFTGEGNGFTFDRYDAGCLLNAVNNAKTVFFTDRPAWDEMVRRNMRKDVSWESSAKKYLDIYDAVTK